jgi:adenosylcobyric acid synthase
MIQGTSSGAGKSTLVIALCRIFSDLGYKISPFKSQNMTSNLYFIRHNSKNITKIQALQAIASRTNPDTRMNPIILKPLGKSVSYVILGGTPFARLTANEYYEKFAIQKGLPKVLNDLESLRNENDIVIIEGAGSPAEINIAKYDIANMILAEKTKSSVILVADIERGGCFASIVGTLKLLTAKQRRLIKGIIINKFSGEKSVLDSALISIETITKKKIIGIIPKINFKLPSEDSLDNIQLARNEQTKKFMNNQIDIVASSVSKCVDLSYLKDILGLCP